MNNELDEFTDDELENVGMTSAIEQKELWDAYEHGDLSKVVEIGTRLLSSPALNNRQKEEIAKMVDQAKHVLNNKEETKGFGL